MKLGERGITLIELIIFIVVGGIFLPLAFIAFTSAVSESTKPETAVRARVVAEAKMSDISSREFESMTVTSTAYDDVNKDPRFADVSASNTPYAGYKWRWEIVNVAYTRTGGVIKVEVPGTWTASTAYQIGDYVRPAGYPTSPYNHFYRVYFPLWEKSKSYITDDYIQPTNGLFYKC
ncbi:MAG: type II secretion system protein, partial [Syntrophorhabdaceae bacterium]|nr:type II secretion system protein [Syntrophorhabdaceae bacterium]